MRLCSVMVELVGNALCLDFTNTVNARPVAARDWLRSPDQLDGWARAAGHPLGEPVADTGDLARARDFRESVHRIFEPLARAADPPSNDLDALIETYADGAGRARLSRTGQSYALTWPGPRTLQVLCWEVAGSAVDLLRHGPLDRLGECPSCGWLFLDTSKNRRRRWCSMATCGSRDKARRYYQRHTS